MTDAQNIFEVYVSVDAATLADKHATFRRRVEIIDSFTASLDFWIAERQLEARP